MPDNDQQQVVMVLLPIPAATPPALWQSHWDGLIDLEQFKAWCNGKD